MMRAAWVMVALLSAWPVHAATVRTLNGAVYEGLISLEAGGLVVRTAAGEETRVGLDRVLVAQFRTPEEKAAKDAGRRWMGRDLGQVRVPGSVHFAGEMASIRASGADIAGNVEEGYFAYQVVEGDGQIVARVGAVGKTDPMAKAGLMIRFNPAGGVPYGMLVAHAGGGVRFQYRSRPGRGVRHADGQGHPVPCWLKLVRRGNRVAGYVSENGQDWSEIGSETIALPPQALFGLVVSARNRAAVCTARFDHVEVRVEKEERSQGGRGAFEGVVLRQGSRVGGKIRGINESAVRVWREREVSIPLAEVARVQVGEVREGGERLVGGERGGVLLANGDFVEGEVVGLERGRVEVRSILFGPRRFDLGQVVAMVWRGAERGATRYEVRGADGSVLLSDRVAVEGGAVRVEVPMFGKVRVGADQILELRAGAGRFRSLAELKPVRVERDGGLGLGVPYVVDGTPSGVGMSLGGQVCERGIGLAGGASVTYELGERYGVFMFHAGVPDGVLPTASVRFVVKVDGKPIYRSEGRTSVDEPLRVTLGVSGAKELMVGVETGTKAGVGACGVFGDPVLVE